MEVFSWIGDKLREQDFFASNVTLTIAGQDRHNTKIGGAATILVVLGVLVQSMFAFRETYTNPSYNKFPTTYNYEYSKQINDFDIQTNMMAYSIYFHGPPPEEPFSYFRLLF